tara:strand:+ start:148 stop:495 length:348 start_codon:yes stop_codon:yes gene_type:complete
MIGNDINNKNAVKYSFSDDLLTYCKLDNKNKYYINYIVNRIENKLEKRWGKYILDDDIKKIYTQLNNYNYCPSSISRTALIRLVKNKKIDRFNNYNSIMVLKLYDDGNPIKAIYV